MKKVAGSPLPVWPLHEMIDFGTEITVTVPVGNFIFGETPARDLVPICGIIRHLAPRRIFEFGTFTGSTTRAMILNAPTTAEIWTLDFDSHSRSTATGLNAWNKQVDPHIIGKRFRETEKAVRIHQILCNSLEFDPQPFCASMDFIYVDASHGYRYVVNDTTKAFEMLSPRGTIVWHDYPTFSGVKKHLEELPARQRPTRICGTAIAIFSKATDERLAE